MAYFNNGIWEKIILASQRLVMMRNLRTFRPRNQLRRWGRLMAFYFCLQGVAGSLFAQTGNLTGTIELPDKVAGKRVAVEKYTGKISGKVSPAPIPVAGVWLTQEGLTAPDNPPDVKVAQRGYQFAESLLVVPLKTKVFFPNEDSDYHNIYSLSKGNRFDIGRYLKDEQPTPFVIFKNTGLVRLNCEIHEHMQAHVLVVDSPYYTRTDGKGNFQFKNVPAGNYTLNAQIDKKNIWKSTVQIVGRKTEKVTLGKIHKQ